MFLIATDSGTVVESILGVPSIQMRLSTERPEVYDVDSSIKFDPTKSGIDFTEIIQKVKSIPDGEIQVISEIIVNEYN